MLIFKSKTSDQFAQEQAAWQQLIHQLKYDWFISISSYTELTIKDVINFKNRLRNAMPKTIFYGWINFVRTVASLHAHSLLSSAKDQKHIPLSNISLDVLIEKLNAEKIEANTILDDFGNKTVKFKIKHLQVCISKLNQSNDQTALINYFTNANNSNQIEECLHIEPIRLNRLNKIAAGIYAS